MHLLSLIVFLPVLFSLLIWLCPENKLLKPLALVLCTIEFLVSLLLFKYFDPSIANIQLAEQYNWISSFGIQYFFAIDGISFWLVLMTTFLTPLVLLGSWTSINKKLKGFFMSMFLLETTMLGTFLAMDGIFFYCFFEMSLIPMFFMIGIWGGPRKRYATTKFFIYTMLGSVFMLLSIIALIFLVREETGTFSASLLDFYKLQNIPFIAGNFLNTQTLLFFGFSIAFAIKVPLFPFHTWLPDAHVEAPTPGSVILAGVMLKMGTYGFLRFVIPIFPEATAYWAWIFLLVGVIGIVYGALVAMVQPDIKKLVAYSSVSHMGYVIMGLFTLNVYGVSGSLYQMLNHGISTGALFLLVGMLYERTHSRKISDYGGLAVEAPIFTIFFLIVTFSSIAVPMTNGFIGEFLILLGTFNVNMGFGIAAVIGVILGAAYMLWLVKRVFFGKQSALVNDYKNKSLDMNLREVLVMLPLVIMIFWMGLAPNHFLRWSQKSIDHLIKNQKNYTLSVSKINNIMGEAPRKTNQ